MCVHLEFIYTHRENERAGKVYGARGKESGKVFAATFTPQLARPACECFSYVTPWRLRVVVVSPLSQAQGINCYGKICKKLLTVRAIIRRCFFSFFYVSFRGRFFAFTV